jgi:hypothetical protein
MPVRIFLVALVLCAWTLLAGLKGEQPDWMTVVEFEDPDLEAAAPHQVRGAERSGVFAERADPHVDAVRPPREAPLAQGIPERAEQEVSGQGDWYCPRPLTVVSRLSTSRTSSAWPAAGAKPT